MKSSELDHVPNWQGVLAAIVYLSTFVAVAYGVYAVSQHGAFFPAVLSAFPLACAGCALLFLISATAESVQSASALTSKDAKRTELRFWVHR